MSYRLDIREDALADIEAAAAWYAKEQSALGADFVRAVRHAINSGKMERGFAVESD